MSYVIALDGPAGSGKSTVASMVAEATSFVHADSGAIYRTVTYALMEKLGTGKDRDDFLAKIQSSVVEDPNFSISDLQVSASFDGLQKNFVGSSEVSDKIRMPDVAERVGIIADHVPCRQYVNEILRDFAGKTNLVCDGRDIGTVVFPDTPYKFFLEASVQVRAKRRLKEYQEKGIEISFEKIEKEIETRDAQDRNRKVGALVKADDAILIDTSDLDQNDVLTRILSHLQVMF